MNKHFIKPITLLSILILASTSFSAERGPTFSRFQAIVNSGVVAGGTVDTYETGTANRLATFTDQGGLTENDNPLTLDTNGQADIWLLPNTQYRFVIKDSDGVILDTVDEITGVPITPFDELTTTTLFVTGAIQIGTGQSAVTFFDTSGTTNIPGYTLALNDTGTGVTFIPPTGLDNQLTNAGFGVWSNGWVQGVFANKESAVSGYISASGLSISVTSPGTYQIGDHIVIGTGTDGSSGLTDGMTGISIFEITNKSGNDLTVEGDAFVTGAVSGLTDIWLAMTGVSPLVNTGPDGWRRNAITLDLWRAPISGTSILGSLYSLYMKKGANAVESVEWPLLGIRSDISHLTKYRGQTITAGAYVITWETDNVRLIINDGSETKSVFHPGDGIKKWLEVTGTISQGATPFFIGIANEKDSGNTAYVAGFCLVFGASIGSGNCVNPAGEWVNVDTKVTLDTYDFDTPRSTATQHDENLEVLSNLKIPKNATAVLARFGLRDSGSATGSAWFRLGFGTTTNAALYLDVGNDSLTLSGNSIFYQSGVLPLDVNGDFNVTFEATGTGTLDNFIEIHRIQLK